MPTPFDTIGGWLTRRVRATDARDAEAVVVVEVPPPAPPSPAADDLKELEALVGTLNRSAERVQSLWFGFLTVSVYFALSATSTTHRMLFLEDPLTLPLINLALPLDGFYIVGPVLYLVFHAYFLMMLVLLARTARTFDQALERTLPAATHAAQHERFRMRIENTLFVQVIVGGLRERRGINGSVLRTIALVTVAATPILVLLSFQLRFLPYHDVSITYWHRLLIVIDVLLVLGLWPSYLREGGERMLPRLRVLPVGLALCVTAFSLLLATFPGERLHHNIFARGVDWTFGPLTHAPVVADDGRVVNERRTVTSVLFGSMPEVANDANLHGQIGYWGQRGLFPNRLLLANVDLVDDEKLKRIVEDNNREGETRAAFVHAVTGRDFTGAIFGSADLRRVDFSGAEISHARFNRAWLQEARFRNAEGTLVQFIGARMSGASFDAARLPKSSFMLATLHGASFDVARIPGANFNVAQAQGATFNGTRMHRAIMLNGRFQGATFNGTYLDLAIFGNTSLDGASLSGVTMMGAQLQAQQFDKAGVGGAVVWMAQGFAPHADCTKYPPGRWVRDQTRFLGWLGWKPGSGLPVPPDTETLEELKRMAASHPPVDVPEHASNDCSELAPKALAEFLCTGASSTFVWRAVMSGWARFTLHEEKGRLLARMKAARVAAAEHPAKARAASDCPGALALTDADIRWLEDMN